MGKFGPVRETQAGRSAVRETKVQEARVRVLSQQGARQDVPIACPSLLKVLSCIFPLI